MSRFYEPQNMPFGPRMEALYNLPDKAAVADSSLLTVVLWMILIDCKRPFQVALLRLQAAGFARWLVSLCGMRATNQVKLEHAIVVAQRQAALSKRILFLSRTQQVFHLWHVIHRPFSFAFAIQVLLHISIALFLGYRL
jgi:hypothetical protein